MAIKRILMLLTVLIVSVTLRAGNAIVHQANPNTSRTDIKPLTPDKQSLNLRILSSAIKQPRQVVIRDARTFAALWAEHVLGLEPTPTVPTIDFKKQDVVAVFAGSKSTGGYSVEIGDPKRTSKKAVVPVTIYKPGPGTMVTQAFTSPCSFRAVPKLPIGVTFQVVEKAH